ncbi:hypothetical protein N9733_05750 [Akkermansiaceae bacterium]|nr:hypothetical protein [Akkermansiaceae bacterium]
MESNAITLDHSVEIYVPTESRYSELLPEYLRAEILEQVKSSLYDWFGGVTPEEDLRLRQIEGFWRPESH